MKLLQCMCIKISKILWLFLSYTFFGKVQIRNKVGFCKSYFDLIKETASLLYAECCQLICCTQHDIKLCLVFFKDFLSLIVGANSIDFACLYQLNKLKRTCFSFFCSTNRIVLLKRVMFLKSILNFNIVMTRSICELWVQKEDFSTIYCLQSKESYMFNKFFHRYLQ